MPIFLESDMGSLLEAEGGVSWGSWLDDTAASQVMAASRTQDPEHTCTG